MIRTALALACAGLFLVACDAKPAPGADGAKPDAAANLEAALKARAEAAAARSAAAATASVEVTDPKMKAFVETYEKITDIILTVKDQASVKTAAEKLRPLVPQMQAQAEALQAMSETELSAASRQAGTRLITTAGKMNQHILSLPLDVQESLGAELEKLPSLPAPH